MLETKRVSTRLHSVENSLWKRLWIFRKTDNGMNEQVTFSLLISIFHTTSPVSSCLHVKLLF